ncbi:MAG: hypothetical protein M9958_00075 [Chitinophagales bacterium]|nr:hypothetical protein [Chitinophagales bacterium]
MDEQYNSNTKKSFLIEELFNTSIFSTDLKEIDIKHNSEINLLSFLFSFQNDKPDKNFRKTISDNRNTYLNYFPDNDNIKGIITHNLAFVPYYQDIQFQSFPLWIYKKSKQSEQEKISNLNPHIIEQFSKILALEYLEKAPPEGNLCFAQNIEIRDEFRTYFSSIDIIDYTLNCMNSQLKNQQTPLIYFPEDEYTFWQKVQAGKKLRTIQQLENIDVDHNFFPIGDLTQIIIQKIDYNNEQIFINDKSFLSKISEWEWSFQIGQLKPIQKYLKDKIGSSINMEEIEQFIQYISAVRQMRKWCSKH